jgi:hypothetical protein
MRNSLIIITVILVLACSNSNVPKGILTEKEITPILVEIHLAESIFAQRYSLAITGENYQEDLYLSILKKYKLDRKVFEASVLYYGKHPEIYRPIYDEVLNRLNEMAVKAKAKDSIRIIQDRLKAEQDRLKPVKDTVKTVKDIKTIQ